LLFLLVTVCTVHVKLKCFAKICFSHHILLFFIFEYSFGIYWKKVNNSKKCFIALKIYEYMNWIYTIIEIEYTNWIYIKLFKSLRGRFLCGVGVVLRTYELVYEFVLSYTPYFHIVEWSTGVSNQDRYSHRITIHVVASDYAGMITNNCDIRWWCSYQDTGRYVLYQDQGMGWYALCALI
jgi:hypothetical protein